MHDILTATRNSLGACRPRVKHRDASIHANSAPEGDAIQYRFSGAKEARGMPCCHFCCASTAVIHVAWRARRPLQPLFIVPLVLIQQVLSRSRVPHMVARSPDHLAKQINNLLLDNDSSEFCFISGFNRCDRDLDRWPTIARDRKVSF